MRRSRRSKRIQPLRASWHASVNFDKSEYSSSTMGYGVDGPGGARDQRIARIIADIIGRCERDGPAAAGAAPRPPHQLRRALFDHNFGRPITAPPATWRGYCHGQSRGVRSRRRRPSSRKSWRSESSPKARKSRRAHDAATRLEVHTGDLANQNVRRAALLPNPLRIRLRGTIFRLGTYAKAIIL